MKKHQLAKLFFKVLQIKLERLVLVRSKRKKSSRLHYWHDACNSDRKIAEFQSCSR